MLEKKEIKYPDYRWVILLLVFLATMINYLDRIVIYTTAPVIMEDLSLSEKQYGYILTAFTMMYAVGFLFVGKIIDRLGTKLGYLLSMITWSFAATLTGLSKSLFSLITWRGVLGITQSGNFPAAIKATAEWFPPKQRALAVSLFNSGPHIAQILGPPVIALLALQVGWRLTVVILGLAGVVLAGLWKLVYKHPEHLNDENTSPVAQTPIPKKRIPWTTLIKDKRTWGIMAGKFCTDPVWWFYISWLPVYLNDKHGFDLKQIGFAIPVIYISAIIMANIAGWYSGRLVTRGWSDYKARKCVMLICAMCLPFTALSALSPSPWIIILLVSIATGAHSGYSANIFTLASDCFPPEAVATITGLGGFAGSFGGAIISSYIAGLIIKHFGYVPLFILMGFMHPISMLFIHLLVKKGPEKIPAAVDSGCE